jgi:hypothetical protein
MRKKMEKEKISHKKMVLATNVKMHTGLTKPKKKIPTEHVLLK